MTTFSQFAKKLILIQWGMTPNSSNNDLSFTEEWLTIHLGMPFKTSSPSASNDYQFYEELSEEESSVHFQRNDIAYPENN